MSALEPRPGVLRLAPYVQGRSAIEGVTNPIKLSSNESSQGPSPLAIEAYHRAAAQLNRYPPGSQWDLREAIGASHGLDPNRILCGNGSDELIQLMVRAYLGSEHQALLSENGFVMSNIHCTAQGAELVIAPEKNYTVDVDAMLERVTSKTRFCTIANPNNPAGTYISGEELRRLHAGLPENCLLLVDDAYAEYATAADYADGAELVDDFDNVVMTRTFSKIYGLPSLRIGWAYCPTGVFDLVQRIRTPFNTNGPGLAAAAAAVRDRDYMLSVREENARWRERITAHLTRPGIEVIPSQANFYLLRFDAAGGKSGTGAAEFLHSQGIIPRPTGGSDQFLRITIGVAHENEAVLDALDRYMDA
ncbi:MAG: histidinol-phosphate transaminase [Halioglobus sp.]|nr:histidinol-phosphate transaminase [Halioglobus sp.]